MAGFVQSLALRNPHRGMQINFSPMHRPMHGMMDYSVSLFSGQRPLVYNPYHAGFGVYYDLNADPNNPRAGFARIPGQWGRFSWTPRRNTLPHPDSALGRTAGAIGRLVGGTHNAQEIFARTREKIASWPKSRGVRKSSGDGSDSTGGKGITVEKLMEKGLSGEDAQKVFDKAFAGKTPKEQKKLFKNFPDLGSMTEEQKAGQLSNWYIQVAKGRGQDEVEDLYKKAVQYEVEEETESQLSKKIKPGTYYAKDDQFKGFHKGKAKRGDEFKYIVKDDGKTYHIFKKGSDGSWVRVKEKKTKTDYNIGRLLDNLDRLMAGGKVSHSGAAASAKPASSSESDDATDPSDTSGSKRSSRRRGRKLTPEEQTAKVTAAVSKLNTSVGGANISFKDGKITLEVTDPSNPKPIERAIKKVRRYKKLYKDAVTEVSVNYSKDLD